MAPAGVKERRQGRLAQPCCNSLNRTDDEDDNDDDDDKMTLRVHDD